MWPTLFGIKTYPVFYLAAMVLLPLLVRRRCRKQGVPNDRRWAAALGWIFIFGMIVGAKMMFDLLHGAWGGWRYLSPQYYMAGGMWGGPLAYLALAVPAALLYRPDRRAMLDIVALTLPLPMFVAKLACFVNGCCYGAPCDWPWGMTLHAGASGPTDVARHPTPLYELLVLAGILLVYRLLDRERWKGRLLLWFVALYGIGRPLTEYFRGDGARLPDVGPFTASQAVCLTAAGVAGVLLLAASRRRFPRGLATEVPGAVSTEGLPTVK